MGWVCVPHALGWRHAGAGDLALPVPTRALLPIFSIPINPEFDTGWGFHFKGRGVPEGNKRCRKMEKGRRVRRAKKASPRTGAGSMTDIDYRAM